MNGIVPTPFADRPATPYWSPRGPWGGSLKGMGDVTAPEVLQAITAGSVAATQVLQGGVMGYQCPVGYAYSPTAQSCIPTGAIGGTVSASGNSGLLLLLLAGAALFFMRNR